MPTYVYRCTENGHQFEAVQSMSDDALTECEICGGPAKRLLFAPAIHFKGTGFHNTDYGTRKRPKSGEGEGSSGGGEGSGSGGGEGSSGSSGSSDGGTPAAKQATKADTAARTTGP